MKVKTTAIEGLYVFMPTVYEDNRGYFYESFNNNIFNELNITSNFVQENESFSKKGVLRGLHFQKGESAQAKLVRCSKGKVFDVAVDLRKESPTFGKWYGLIISEQNRLQLYIPRGFAHGFSVLSDEAVFNYKCDNLYDKSSEGGIIFDDPLLAINWQVSSPLVSEKDLQLKCFKDLDNDDIFESPVTISPISLTEYEPSETSRI